MKKTHLIVFSIMLFWLSPSIPGANAKSNYTPIVVETNGIIGLHHRADSLQVKSPETKENKRNKKEAKKKKAKTGGILAIGVLLIVIVLLIAI
ncbi:hypothetical protein FKX85_20525 [Echinicola soli]|uniref:Uncharacterized protein n=1 Tax=Echinicola soli TaxID=2591634 RepID=A0A514CN91_9BACT|nr:hypothetical protein [Echinicola soli]QDH81286.1 hypothetical protein FKX85_20525 [Echinicola soli]